MKTIKISGLRAWITFLLVFAMLAAGIGTTGWLYYRNCMSTFVV